MPVTKNERQRESEVKETRKRKRAERKWKEKVEKKKKGRRQRGGKERMEESPRHHCRRPSRPRPILLRVSLNSPDSRCEISTSQTEAHVMLSRQPLSLGDDDTEKKGNDLNVCLCGVIVLVMTCIKVNEEN